MLSQGFDPLGFAKRKDLLLQYREAELKHARLAMLASVGWAASELIHPKLAALLGVKSLLQPGLTGQLEKAPSVLNGGLNAVPPLAWAGLVLITGIVEVILSPSGPRPPPRWRDREVPLIENSFLSRPLISPCLASIACCAAACSPRWSPSHPHLPPTQSLLRQVWRMLAVAEKSMDFEPGDYKFDPLNFYKVADDAERRSFQLKEINNGRLAMIAIAVFAAQEFTADMAVVNLAPQYFTAGPLGNIG